MVNTRRKSQVLQPDPLVAEQSDSSTTSTTRRSTRRSVGNVLATPVEIPTPTRRSRRLSNSSVESANNDTPRPGTRRSTRINKTTGSDIETSDVELVVIKRRKLGEGVDTLIPIREEKNEDRSNPSEDKEKHILVELEEEVEIIDKNSEVEVERSNKAEGNDKCNGESKVAVLSSKEIQDKVITKKSPVKISKVDDKISKVDHTKTEDIDKVEANDKSNADSEVAVLPSKEIEDEVTKQKSPVKISKTENSKTEDTDIVEIKSEIVKIVHLVKTRNL